jgi:hypothetical protein
MNNVYVAKKHCGHIVAAVPANSRKETADIIQRLIVSGYQIELTSASEVNLMFDLDCKCDRPPLLPGFQSIFGRKGDVVTEIIHDEGVDQADVDAMATEPQTEEAAAVFNEGTY